MENKRVVKLIIDFIVVGIFLIFPLFSFAYSDETTHPALTNEVVKFFNTHYPDLELNDKERKLIIQGSIDEDAFGRWMQHYYDPVYNRGLVLLKKWQSSKKWAQDAHAQAGIVQSAFAGSLKAYFSGEDDYSWERAIYEYVWGDKEKGLSALGHTLHLIEDATVPPHTRNDPHLVYLNEVFGDRSPYEHWTSKFDIENIDVIKDLKYKKPIELDTLDEYFDTVASYTNKNFFSKDTIFDEEYNSPVIKLVDNEILNDGEEYTFGYSNNGDKNYKIALIDKKFNKKLGGLNTIYFIEDNDNLILSDYWSILSKQAVLNGAGVVKLFFDEVEKERKTEVLKKKNRSWFQKIYDATAGNIFNTSKALYGSSVDYEDLQGGAVIQSQKEPESPKRATLFDTIPNENKHKSPKRVALSEEMLEEEIVKEVVVVEEDKKTEVQNSVVEEPSTTTEKTFMEIYESKIIPVNRPFFGGGGGGVKTESTVEETSTPPNPPTITFPTVTLFATTTVTFSGTASSTLVISSDFSNATTTADADDEWSLTLSDFSEGATTIQFIATDSDGLDSDATEYSIVVDITAPSFNSFSILQCDYSLRSDGNCLSGSDTLNLSWSSTSTDISYYSITKDGESIATTTATSSSETFSNGSYSVAVVVYDEAGNVATSSVQSVEIFTMPVVINEIAWSGTISSTTDEWIELYNRTSYTIDLSNIDLVANDGVPYLNLSGSIATDSYYLIERTDDNATSVSADLAVTFSYGLSNAVEQLSLIHSYGGQASTTLDSTPSTSSCSGEWCAGTSASDYKSMERIDADTVGTDSTNWSNNNTYTKNGTDSGWNAINGTPRSKNSVSLSSIGFYCPPETSTYISGGYYVQDAPAYCTYLSSSLSVGFPDRKQGDIFKGTIASSTLLNGHNLQQNATTTQNGYLIIDPAQGEDYFVVIYVIRLSGGFDDVDDFRSYFSSGANAPPHMNYGVLEWKYGPTP